jgi:hypothetical protein
MKRKKHSSKRKKKESTALAKVTAPVVEIQKVTPGAVLSPIESVLVGGDLAVLKPDDRFNYYLDVCRSLKLNPLTQPFGYISIKGKMMLYAKKDCAEQLRKIHGVGITSLKREIDKEESTVTVDVTGIDRNGKVDAASGSLYLKEFDNVKKIWNELKGQDRANEIMKCETKAKRRLTLSICGLSMPDETEILTIKDAKILENEEKQTVKELKKVSPVVAEAEFVPSVKAEITPEHIIKSLPQDVKDLLKQAGFDTVKKAHDAYKKVEGDVDALRQWLKEGIKA